MSNRVTRIPGGAVLVATVALTVGCGLGSPRVTFDGSSCKYDGPGTVAPGTLDVTFDNQSGELAGLAFLRLTDDAAIRQEELALIGRDRPVPAQPDPERGQLVGVILAEPGEVVTQAAPLTLGLYVVDCATFEGDGPAHGWRAAALEVTKQ